MNYEIAFYALLWLVVGIWICYKRDWYNGITSSDRDFVLFAAVVFAPCNLIILLFKEFILKDWDNG